MAENSKKDLLKVLATLEKRRAKRMEGIKGLSGRRSDILTAGGQGRYVRHRPAGDKQNVDIAVLPTIKAAIMRSPGKKVKIRRDDFREKIRRRRVSGLICVVFDVSSSMLGEGRAVAAKRLLQELLLDIYQKRDKIALITVYGEKANIVMNFTQNVDLAKQKIEEITFGGTTPLGSGVKVGHDVLRKAHQRERASIPVLILVTDGGANTSISSHRDPQSELNTLFAEVKEAGIFPVAVDVSGADKNLKKLASKNDWEYIAVEKGLEDVLFTDYSIVEDLRDHLLIGMLDRNLGGFLAKNVDEDDMNRFLEDIDSMGLDVEVVRDCQFNCPLGDEEGLCRECFLKKECGQELAVKIMKSPIVRMKPDTTTRELSGEIYVRYLLKPGVLTKARHGFLFIENIDKLPAKTAQALSESLTKHRNLVKSGDFELSHPLDFSFFGSISSENRPLHPSLHKHFYGIYDSFGSDPLIGQIRSMRFRKDFETDPTIYYRRIEQKRKDLLTRLNLARQNYKAIKVESTWHQLIQHSVSDLSPPEGSPEAELRSFKFVSNLAKAIAAFKNHRLANREDVVDSISSFSLVSNYLLKDYHHVDPKQLRLGIAQETQRVIESMLLPLINPHVGHLLLVQNNPESLENALEKLRKGNLSIQVLEGCQVNCDPSNGQELCSVCKKMLELEQSKIIEKEMPIIVIDENTTKEELMGGLYIKHIIKPGILARAHRGILVIKDIEKLDKEVADVLAYTLESGLNLLEREGEVLSHPVDITVIATTEDIDSIEPHLLEQFSMSLKPRSSNLSSVIERAYEGFREEHLHLKKDIMELIEEARDMLQKVDFTASELDFIVRVCGELGTLGNNVEGNIVETAITLAALKGHSTVSTEDTQTALGVALHMLGVAPEETEDYTAAERERV